MKPLLLSSIMILSIKRCRQKPHHVCMSTTRCQMICKLPKSWQLRTYLERAAGFSLPRQNADCLGTPTLIWAMSAFRQIACVLVRQRLHNGSTRYWRWVLKSFFRSTAPAPDAASAGRSKAPMLATWRLLMLMIVCVRAWRMIRKMCHIPAIILCCPDLLSITPSTRGYNQIAILGCPKASGLWFAMPDNLYNCED